MSIKISLAKIEKSNSVNDINTNSAETHITSLFLELVPQFLFIEINNSKDYLDFITNISENGYENSLFRPPILS
jgi:hypothetical protein